MKYTDRLTQDQKNDLSSTLPGSVTFEDLPQDSREDLAKEVVSAGEQSLKDEIKSALTDDVSSLADDVATQAEQAVMPVEITIEADENGDVSTSIEPGFDASSSSRSIPSTYNLEPGGPSHFHFDVEGSDLEGFASLTTGVQIPVGYGTAVSGQAKFDTVKDFKFHFLKHETYTYTDSKGNRVHVSHRGADHIDNIASSLYEILTDKREEIQDQKDDPEIDDDEVDSFPSRYEDYIDYIEKNFEV